MCTAIAHTDGDFYFGRTLDYEHDFGEEIVITPRNFPLYFHRQQPLLSHYAMLGMAAVAESPLSRNEYPLYFEAVNEYGLGMAGLNFVGNAVYLPITGDGCELAPYELPLYLLAQCKTVAEAKTLLQGVKLINLPFSPQFPLSHTHYLLSDKYSSFTLESTAEGLQIYENPVGVLTNNPPFPQQMLHLADFQGLTNEPAENRWCKGVELYSYSRGMGALGLPGDVSSGSRFVRAAFTKNCALHRETEQQRVSQFFHILGTVEQVKGVCKLSENGYECTQYTTCYNASRGILYYTTYDCPRIRAVALSNEELDAQALVRYSLLRETDILLQNGGLAR